MCMLFEKLVDGKQEFEVVDAENAAQAVNSCDGLTFDEKGMPIVDDRKIGYVGVYEVGQINLLNLLDDKNAVHSFYHKKLKEIGINSTTFEKF